MRRLAVVMPLVLAVGAAQAGKKKGRVRPATAAIKAPSGFKKAKLPKGLHTEPPADRWWEAADPCPEGATLDEKTEHDWVRYRCQDADGVDHGPHTSIAPDGHVGTDGWREHGVDHGVQRTFWDNGTLTEQRIYVKGVAHGDAIESQDRGPYRDGERHGLWTLRADGGGEIRGYYVKGKRQGTWLAVSSHRGDEIVTGRARYAKDALEGEVVWWTEDGDLLATITTDWLGRSLQFYGHDQPTLKAGCKGELLVYLQQRVKKDEIECQYDWDTGELAQQTGGSKADLTCPSRSTGYGALCTADLLDPYAVSYAMPSPHH